MFARFIVGNPFMEKKIANPKAKINALLKPHKGRLQSASGEELSALMASILDKAFEGEL
jgi:hypothetical protein